MTFKTLEEANEYQIEMEKKLQESKQALEGLQLKYESLETDFNNSNEEIKRLKIKNYEYLEQIPRGNAIPNSQEPNEVDETKEKIISINDIMNDFKI